MSLGLKKLSVRVRDLVVEKK
jgi:hypothetical protein